MTFFPTNNVQFWSILIVLIPSIICSFFTLSHLLFDRNLRNTLNNDIITVILLVGLVSQITFYPWMLYYLHFEGVWERSPAFCSIWAFISWTFYILQAILFAWATIERHILVFHDRWVSTKKKRFFFHYLPIFSLIVYCLIFYIVADFFPPCENSFFNEYMTCVFFCINGYNFYKMWETLAHQFIPGLIAIIFSVALFIRVIWKKIRVHQPVRWQKHKKLTIQLLSISIVYLIFYFPYICVNCMYYLGYLQNINIDILFILSFLTYFMILVLPFVCMMTLPELGKRMKRIKRFLRPAQAVGPSTLATR